jgi:hypothetical protein
MTERHALSHVFSREWRAPNLPDFVAQISASFTQRAKRSCVGRDVRHIRFLMTHCRNRLHEVQHHHPVTPKHPECYRS